MKQFIRFSIVMVSLPIAWVFITFYILSGMRLPLESSPESLYFSSGKRRQPTPDRLISFWGTLVFFSLTFENSRATRRRTPGSMLASQAYPLLLS